MKGKAWQTWGILLLLYMVRWSHSFTPEGSLQNQNEGENLAEEAQSLFNNMDTKNTPLWKCDGAQTGIQWRIPDNLLCNIPLENEVHKVVALTLYWTDVTHQSIKGYECYGRHLFGWVTTDLINYEYTGGHVRKMRVSPEECIKMAKSHISPNNLAMTKVAEGRYQTSERLKLESKWMRNITGDIEVYFFEETDIAIMELDQMIQTTSLITDRCLYNQTYCPTTYGILVWEKNDVKTCRLREGEDTRCVYTVSKDTKLITCPDLQLSLHDITYVDMCGQKFGSSSQGVFFLQNSKGEIDKIIGTPKTVRGLITKPKARSKREARYMKVNAHEAYINAKFNFLYDIVQNGSKHAVRNLELETCRSNQRQLQMVRYLAETGHPTLVTRFLFGDMSYRASFSGDLLTIYKCIEIRQYSFLPREQCSMEYPIRYIYQHKVQKGYLSPLSHTIIPMPTLMSEPCAPFYFDTGRYVALLTDKATLVNFPTLPKPGDSYKEFNYFPPLSFKSTLGFDITSRTDIGHTYYLLRKIQEKKINSPQNADFIDIERGNPLGLEFITDAVWAPIKSFFSFVSDISSALIICIVLFILVKTGLIKHIPAALKALCLNPCKRLFKKSRKSIKSRMQKYKHRSSSKV